jgi:hypothetical protein
MNSIRQQKMMITQFGKQAQIGNPVWLIIKYKYIGEVVDWCEYYNDYDRYTMYSLLTCCFPDVKIEYLSGL